MPSMLQMRRITMTIIALLAYALPTAVLAQQEEYVLTESDTWEHAPVEAGSQQAMVLRARQTLVRNEYQRARAMATAFIEKYPLNPLCAQMLLIRGDALLAMGDEYKSLFDYEEIAKKHPGSDVFVTALEREYQIAIRYAHGLRKKFLGTIRILNAGDDAQELLILIQERLPGSRLAEQAGMQLADYYFRKAKLRLAAEAYDLFIINYPQSEQINKARQRLIESYLASYRGPKYDDSGLRDARKRLETMRITQPSLAQRIGTNALLVRIYESEARKLLVTSNWYRSINDSVSAEQYIRRLVRRYPDSVATRDALRGIGSLLQQLPESVVKSGPDYEALAQALLGVTLGSNTQGVSPKPQVLLPQDRPLEKTTPVQTLPPKKEEEGS